MRNVPEILFSNGSDCCDVFEEMPDDHDWEEDGDEEYSYEGSILDILRRKSKL